MLLGVELLASGVELHDTVSTKHIEQRLGGQVHTRVQVGNDTTGVLLIEVLGCGTELVGDRPECQTENVDRVGQILGELGDSNITCLQLLVLGSSLEVLVIGLAVQDGFLQLLDLGILLLELSLDRIATGTALLSVAPMASPDAWLASSFFLLASLEADREVEKFMARDAGAKAPTRGATERLCLEELATADRETDRRAKPSWRDMELDMMVVVGVSEMEVREGGGDGAK